MTLAVFQNGVPALRERHFYILRAKYQSDFLRKPICTPLIIYHFVLLLSCIVMRLRALG